MSFAAFTRQHFVLSMKPSIVRCTTARAALNQTSLRSLKHFTRPICFGHRGLSLLSSVSRVSSQKSDHVSCHSSYSQMLPMQLSTAPILFSGLNQMQVQIPFVPQRAFFSKGPAPGGDSDGGDRGSKGPDGSPRDDKDDPDEEKPKSPWAGRLVTLGASASLLAGKTKYLFVALKVTKMAPLASMVLSSLAYGALFGPAYGVGMVGLIFVHECGHAVAMKHYGVPFSPMVFIPFMGAVIAQKEPSRTAWEDAVIALAGPGLGTLGAAAVGVAGYATNTQVLLALADWGYLINLFNLLPIGSMDGGRVAATLSPWLPAGGLALGGWIAYEGLVANPIFYLILMSGAYTTGSRLMGYTEPPHEYRKLNSSEQGAVGAAYVALIAALLLLMRANNQKRLTPSQVRAQRDRLAAQKGGAGSDYGHYDDDDDDDDLRAAAFDPAATATAFEEDGAKYDDFFASSTHKEGNDDDGAEPWWKAIQK